MPRQTKLSIVPDDNSLSGVEPSGFYQTPNWATIKAIKAKLTSADWCVWTYLQMLDPYGDRLKETPNPEEIAKAVGLSEKQVKRSTHKLEEMGLWEFKIIEMKSRNLATVKSRQNCLDKVVHSQTKLSESGQSCPQPDKVVPKKTKLSVSTAETLTQSASDFSHTSSYSDQTNSECVCVYNEISEITHTEILKTEEEEQPGNSDQVGQIIDISSVKTKNSGIDQFSGGQAGATIKYDSRLGMRPPAPKPKYLIPDGDWLNSNGQLDDQFLTSIAKQWMKSPTASFHQMPIEEVKGLVFSHFAKDHNSLAIKWEAYCQVETRHAVSTKLALDAGISIPLEQQQRVIGASNAIASNTHHQDSVFTASNQLTIGSECTENHQAYRLIESAPIDESEQIENLKKLASLSSVIGRMPTAVNRRSRNLKTSPSDINEANQWLLDPALRVAALQWANNNGFSFDSSEIYQEEF